MSYARGRYALGECARSGRKMLLKDMVRDGYQPNLLVDPAWYEPEHPLEDLQPVDDPVALYRPSPRRDSIDAEVAFPLYDVATGQSGGDLFDVLPCDGFDFDAQVFKVALYADKPGTRFAVSGEAEGAGYTPGGVPVIVTAADGHLTLGAVAWEYASIGARWLLVYAEDSGAGLLRVNLGATHESVNGAFAVDFSNVTVAMTATEDCIAGVYSPRLKIS